MPKAAITLTVKDAALIAKICESDGHSIVPAEEFAGVNPEFVKAVTVTHKSSKSDPKWMITTDGGPVKELTGIYTLTALQLACNVLGLETEAGRYFGRGRQARAYTEALENYVAAQTRPTK